jgi:hypothetical protein
MAFGQSKIIDVDTLRGVKVPKNFIVNGDAELPAPKWTTYADAAGVVPVDCTGGSPSLTFARSSTSPMSGLQSFILTKDSANRQGNGAAYSFTTESGDKHNVLQVEFDWLLNSGTFAGSTAPATPSDVTVYLYDVTNAVVIEPAPRLLEPALSGYNYKYKGVFQTSSSTSYRLCLHVSSTSTSAYSLKMDNFSISKQVSANGAYVGDWKSYTPTGTWVTNTTYTGMYRRVGDSLEGTVHVALSGAPTATTLQVGIPSGLAIDTTKLTTAVGSAVPHLGMGSGYDGSTVKGFYVAYNNTTSVYLLYPSSTTGTISAVSSTAPSTWASGNYINVNFKVPIVGWSSNLQLSNDAETRVISAKAIRTSTSQTATAGVALEVIGNTSVQDTHGAYSTSTGRFTAPVSGYYLLKAQTLIETGGTAPSDVSSYWKKNGTGANLGIHYTTDTVASKFYSLISNTEVYLNAGDYVSLWVLANSQNVTVTSTGGTNENTVLSVSRISGPAQIAASETVAARYTDVSGQVIGTSDATFIYNTKVYDTHNAYNTSTGVFTAPIAGKYRIVAKVVTAGVSLSTSQVLVANIRKNSSTIESNAILGNGASNNYYITVTSTVDLLAGGTLDVRAAASVATTGITASPIYNTMTIERIGN